MSVQSLSHVRLFAIPWTAGRQASLSFTKSSSLLRLICIESVILYNNLNLCCPLLLLPSISDSIRVFSNDSVLRTRWPKYRSFRFSISPSNEYSCLISFGIDWFDILWEWLVWSPCSPRDSEGSPPTLQFKTSIFQCSAFFMVQLSYPYMTTAKTIALTRQSFVREVMSLLFNLLSRLVIAFLPRSKPL